MAGIAPLKAHLVKTTYNERSQPSKTWNGGRHFTGSAIYSTRGRFCCLSLGPRPSYPVAKQGGDLQLATQLQGHTTKVLLVKSPGYYYQERMSHRRWHRSVQHRAHRLTKPFFTSKQQAETTDGARRQPVIVEVLSPSPPPSR